MLTEVVIASVPPASNDTVNIPIIVRADMFLITFHRVLENVLKYINTHSVTLRILRLLSRVKKYAKEKVKAK